MKSKFRSWCVKCRQTIRVGEEISKDEEIGKWVHETCPNGQGTFVSAKNLADAISQVSDVSQVFEAKKEFKPSVYQQAVFDFIQNEKGNAVVEAVAGSGKTTTIVEALKFTNPKDRVGFLAFNKHIADELKNRQNLGLIPSHVHISTIHSLGFSVIRKLEEKPEVDRDKVSMIMDAFWPIRASSGVDPITRKINSMKRAVMRKLVGLAKGTLVDYENQNEVLEMAERYGVEVDEESYDCVVRLPQVMKSCLEDLSVIDYDDMIWLPLVVKRLKINMEKFDVLFIDETQDLNKAQVEFVMNSLQPQTGRIIAVGDRKQSLYGFRGADVKAIPRMVEMLDAKVLPLSISYRCPRLVVEAAKELVPQIESFEGAKDGEIIEDMLYPIFMGEVKPGDMVICRTNAPLVKPAFTLIRKNVKAIIRGQDIGEKLIKLVEKFNTDDLIQFEGLLREYTEREHSRLLEKGKELAAEMIIDQHEVLMGISNESRTVMELVEKLRMLFSDKVEGVIFSSVHRAKGLEAETVYILRRDLMPHPRAKAEWEVEQEMNTLYVAITRSKNKLAWVMEE